MTTVISAIISAVVAAIVGLWVSLQDRSKFFSTIVSAERMVWIKDIRKLCADLCSICEQYTSENIPPEQYAAFLQARNGILIRLDPGNYYAADDKLINLLKEPDFKKIKENVPRIRTILMSICKNEWEKVKIEAGNTKRKVDKINKTQAELNKEFHKRGQA